MAINNVLTVTSTVVLRAVSYFFLRWGLLPPLAPIAFTAFAIYIPSSITSFFSSLQDGQEEVVRTQTTRIRQFEEVDGDVIEDVDVTGTQLTIDGSQTVGLWRTILAGVPNPRNLVLTLLTFLINLACVTMVADRLYSEHLLPTEDLSFVRPGFVSDKEVKFLVREPDQTKMPVVFEIRVKESELPFSTDEYLVAGKVQSTSDDTDYTAVVDLALNHHSQRTYEWRTSNGHSGEFTSAPKAGKYPDKFDGKFTFLSTSCIVNRLPYNPLDHPLSIPGMRQLSKVLPNLSAQFMLFLGDFIYADVPREWGESAADFRQKYRAVYASPEWPSVGQNLSWIHVLDDHEIHNDWDGNTTGVYAAAVDPWHHYHTAVNPPAAKKSNWTISTAGPTWFEFAQGPANFFMADTRSYRSSNKIDYEDKEKTMLGLAQLSDLLAFLRRPEPRGVDWKVVASSVPFTKNWPVNVQDTWGGFLAERQVILEAMWETAARGIGVVVLSGDRHEFAATKFPPPQGSKWTEEATVYEFSASPLSQFYSPIGTYKQVDDEDVKIKYINSGYSKFGAITIEKVPESGRSSLSYRLFVDGVEAWNTTVLSPERISAGNLWERFTGSR
ncbi:hypothetical protein INS49_014526 [Diaporthe citri]|uniref:uncharacterized protein n=1 Tax=Diaporthe citri TaxID=83186 RepID=UPI001C7EBB09|nr:uncharacterized protein INS49_014526 [Diaporthe citri]KAG6356652.1 hypothetical protein INS49_014526 [Diaporthe citri]